MRKFNISIYPILVQNSFFDPLATIEVVLQTAIDLGITNANSAADLMFFKNHPERMHSGIGTAITEKEKDLIKEWKAWHDMASSLIASRQSWEGRMFLPMGLNNERIIKLEKIITAHKKKPVVASFKRTVKKLSPKEQTAVYYLLLLWTRTINNKKMYRAMYELLAQADDKESKNGRFPLAAGNKIIDTIKLRRKEMPAKFNCLNFIANHVLYLISDEEDYRTSLEVARARYFEVKAGRNKETDLNVGTITSLAAELRLENLAGLMHYAKWNGKDGKKRAYVPSPVDFISRFTDKPGWYFFIMGVASYHTQFVGVKKTRTSTVFQIIDDKHVYKLMSPEEATEKFNNQDYLRSTGHRLWMIYRPGE